MRVRSSVLLATSIAGALLVSACGDSDSGAAIEAEAKKQGVQTIDDDRLTLGGSADYYVSFDNTEVGEEQGRGLAQCLGAGDKNIVHLNGSPTDDNAGLFSGGANTLLLGVGVDRPVAAGGARGRGTEDVRRHDLAALLGLVHDRGAVARAQVTRELGLNRSTIGALVGSLVDAGLLVEQAPADLVPGRVGRPSLEVRPRAGGAEVLAGLVDVHELQVVRVGLGGSVLGRRTIATSTPPTPSRAAQLLAGAAADLLAEARPEPLVGVGLAVPGTVRTEDGVIASAPNLGWTDAPFGALASAALEDRTGRGSTSPTTPTWGSWRSTGAARRWAHRRRPPLRDVRPGPSRSASTPTPPTSPTSSCGAWRPAGSSPGARARSSPGRSRAAWRTSSTCSTRSPSPWGTGRGTGCGRSSPTTSSRGWTAW